MNILVTGGAGFIGSFLVDELVKRGHFVRILDNLEPQVHQGKIPGYLNKQAEFIKGDVRDENVVKKTIQDIDIIFHQAALVGVGQSMYDIKRYVDINTVGTANLLNVLVNGEHSVKKILVASSMSTYGEGGYVCEECGDISPKLRREEQMAKGDWELYCQDCGKRVKPIPTKETKLQDTTSIYAITKKSQEEMFLRIGRTYGIPAVALRYFNVYGPRQSLSNPYTGVCAIFISRVKNNNAPVIYEDGMQTRDFVSVHDVVQANILAMENKSANYEVYNIGSGDKITIKQVAETIIKLSGKRIKSEITSKFRKGDVRHCFSDITKIKNDLDFESKVSFLDGMKELIKWSEGEEAEDKFDKAIKELEDKGLA